MTMGAGGSKRLGQICCEYIGLRERARDRVGMRGIVGVRVMYINIYVYIYVFVCLLKKTINTKCMLKHCTRSKKDW